MLIINSYHPGYAWSDGELRGVLQTLLREHPLMLPGIEYLDWKRASTPEREEVFLEMLRLKYRPEQLRVVITLDDKAFELALQNRHLLGSAPIVFGGVNRLDRSRYGGSFTNLTGVVETKDFDRTIDLVQRLQPDVHEIVGYHDNTESALANRRAFEESMKLFAPGLSCRFIENWNKDELLTQLSALPSHSVAFSLGATRDAEGVLLADDLDFLRTVAERCAVPIYLISEPIVPLFSTGNWNAAVWSGVGGSLVSGERHGEQVGEMALRVLQGEPIESIAIITNSMGRLAVDWYQMKRFQLPISALPEGTEIYNQPDNFYRINKNNILAGLAVLLGLSVAVAVLAVNIILRRRVERQNAQLLAAVERAGEMVIMMNAGSQQITYINPAIMRLSGWPEETVRATSLACLFPGQETDCIRQICENVRKAETYSEQLECLHKEGHLLKLMMTGTVVRNPAGQVTHYILLARDVTREVNLEEQMRTAHKMEAVGLLAGGVAHDFNNLLQVIIGHTQMAMDPSQSATEREASLSIVLSAAQAGIHLPRQLLAFGRRQSLLREDTDLNILVADFLKIIRKLIGEQIEVEFIPCSGIGNVHADHRQIEQVILNLCVNARDAMENGGRLWLQLDEVDLDARFCEVNPWAQEGRFARLSVRDSGSGMKKETLNRIFEPFFTTKPSGQGTGLGLAVVYGIVQQHEGLIQVESRLGKGTTFSLYLRLSEPLNKPEEAAPSIERLPDTRSSNTSSTRTILLVEDESIVRKLSNRVLSRAGYLVIEATDGVEAVDCFTAHADEIDLVLMDMVMPKMSGPAAAKRIMQIRPDIPILFSSGYSADWGQLNDNTQQDVQIIQKPYESATLLARIDALLRGAS